MNRDTDDDLADANIQVGDEGDPIPEATLDGFTEAEIVAYLRENPSLLGAACVEASELDPDAWYSIIELTTERNDFSPRQLVRMVGGMGLLDREEFWALLLADAVRLGLPKADLL